MDLSMDHKPNDPIEKERIEKNGIYQVTEETVLINGKKSFFESSFCLIVKSHIRQGRGNIFIE
jgi:hypothetical protein